MTILPESKTNICVPLKFQGSKGMIAEDLLEAGLVDLHSYRSQVQNKVVCIRKIHGLELESNAS